MYVYLLCLTYVNYKKRSMEDTGKKIRDGIFREILKKGLPTKNWVEWKNSGNLPHRWAYSKN